MPFVEFGFTVMAELIFLTPGGRAENTLWFLKDSVWSANDGDELAAGLEQWYSDYGQYMSSDEVQLVQIDVTDMSDQNGFKVERQLTASIAGAVVGGVMPGNVTVTCSFRTGKRGRSYRGRNYIVGVPRSVVDDDQITIAYAAVVTTGYESINPIIVTETNLNAVHVVAGRIPLGTTPETYMGVSTPVTSYVTERTIDSQRRRLLGRGG